MPSLGRGVDPAPSGGVQVLGVLFMSEGRMDWDKRIGAASAVMWILHWSVVVKRELS